MRVVIYTFIYRLVLLFFFLYCILNSNWQHSSNNLNAFHFTLLHDTTVHTLIYIYFFFFVTVAVVLSEQEQDISLIKEQDTGMNFSTRLND